MAQGLDRQIERLEARFQGEAGGRIFASLADAYRRAGDLERARELVEQGLARHPAFASGYIVSGWVHRERGDDAAAVLAFGRALELDPENVLALRNLAELEERAGSWADALRHYEMLQALDPGDPEIEERLARLRAGVAEAAAEPEPAAGAELGLREPAEAEAGAAAEGWFEAGGEFALEAGGREGEEEEGAGEPAAGAEVPFEGFPEPELAGEPPAGALAGYAGERDEAEEGVPATEVVTQTMAELYADQGFYDRAVAVYRGLVKRDPDNEALLRRLAELEAALCGGAEGAEVEELAGEPEAMAEAGAAAEEYDAFFADMVEVVVPDLEVVSEGVAGREPAGTATGAQERQAAAEPQEGEDTVEVLAQHWAAGPGETLEVSTPFAWPGEAETAPEAEEDEGPPVREYFERLLAWTPRAVPVEEPAPEVGMHEEKPAPSQGLAPEAGTREEEPAPLQEPAPAAAEQPVSAEALEEEPWLLTPLPTEEAVAETPVPAEAMADEPFPWELESEPPAERGAEGLAVEPAVTAPEAGAEAGTREAEAPSVEEDDDLETFREWLKSLKR